MAYIRMEAPPLPHFVACGFTRQEPGFKHLNRRSLGVFDLLVVSSGVVHIGEDDRQYELSAGQALLLRPDCHHYPTRPSAEETGLYWLHFSTDGKWTVQDEPTPDLTPDTKPCRRDYLAPQPFSITMPQYTPLQSPAAMYKDLDQLAKLELEAHQQEVCWEQQQLLQRVLKHLAEAGSAASTAPAKICAQKAASYLRTHYKRAITAQELGEQLNFHPVYIARCMQKEFGCSPFEYLTRYRIEQAKLLMVRTDMAIARIAEEVGFQHAAYFSTCFLRYEGINPRSYRRQFS